jgi:glutaredoxin-related protein
MSNARDVALDIAKYLQGTFKRTTRQARKAAWRTLSTGKGKEEIDRLLDNPDRSLNTISNLNFKEWIKLTETIPATQQKPARKNNYIGILDSHGSVVATDKEGTHEELFPFAQKRWRYGFLSETVYLWFTPDEEELYHIDDWLERRGCHVARHTQVA